MAATGFFFLHPLYNEDVLPNNTSQHSQTRKSPAGPNSYRLICTIADSGSTGQAVKATPYCFICFQRADCLRLQCQSQVLLSVEVQDSGIPAGVDTVVQDFTAPTLRSDM